MFTHIHSKICAAIHWHTVSYACPIGYLLYFAFMDNTRYILFVVMHTYATYTNNSSDAVRTTHWANFWHSHETRIYWYRIVLFLRVWEKRVPYLYIVLRHPRFLDEYYWIYWMQNHTVRTLFVHLLCFVFMYLPNDEIQYERITFILLVIIHFETKSACKLNRQS